MGGLCGGLSFGSWTSWYVGLYMGLLIAPFRGSCWAICDTVGSFGSMTMSLASVADTGLTCLGAARYILLVMEVHMVWEFS